MNGVKGFSLSTIIGCILFLTIGCAPFLIVNTLWAELVFLEELPEGDDISTILSNTYNVANIGLFLYGLGQLFGSKFERFVRDDVFQVVLILIGLVGCTLLSFGWDVTIPIDGHRFSVIVYIGSIISGIVGCFSMVTAFGLASKYRPVFTPWLSMGLSLSGIITALWSEVQLHVLPVRAVGLTFAGCGCALLLALLALLVIMVVPRPFQRAPVPEEEPAETLLPRDTPPPLLVLAIPVVMQVVNAAGVYFVMPGLLPYMVRPYGASLQALYNAVYQVTGVVGRALAGVTLLHRVHVGYYLAVYVCGMVLLLGTVPLGVNGPFIMQAEWIAQVSLLGALTVLNGFIGTVVYTMLNTDAVPPATRARVSRVISLGNQVGYAVGSVGCLAAVHLFRVADSRY
ncbi:Prokaryotic membrane lipoprotein lipid attachment site [Carpediemonas membranifera]|uniref:Prokaryotic membrane lipoprotein lipid attachment site n=1 Tax=Carpediemonas membranifera TaxID=201153 RepID=A0A8J6AV75_9EUKA|nr:Prokaryotic membrane lipoprotein lipid attachment site [Carpediemonas membranifera]|eukprot:KAG9395023.1 Prokaryotic membrane lipoprotein lipid attachment site [Carpediemonas membranifera]